MRSLLTLALGLQLAVLGACGGSGNTASTTPTEAPSNTPTAGTSEASTTPPETLPALEVTKTWFVDNHTHAEPMAVPGVTVSTPDTLLVVFVASDSGQGPGRDGPPLNGAVRSVTGGGLQWTRRAHAHLATTREPGVAEVWTAWAATTEKPFAVRVSRDNTHNVNALCDNWSGGSGPDVCNGTVFVQAIVGADVADPIGATAIAGAGTRSGRPGPLRVTLTATRAGSLVEAVGADWSGAAPRTLLRGQTMLHQDAATPQDDTYWVQGLVAPVRAPKKITIGLRAPANHDANMAAIEIVPSR